jgi:hypothetical protein
MHSDFEVLAVVDEGLEKGRGLNQMRFRGFENLHENIKLFEEEKSLHPYYRIKCCKKGPQPLWLVALSAAVSPLQHQVLSFILQCGFSVPRS